MSRCEHLIFFTKLEVFNVLGWSIFIKPVLLNNYISGTLAITAKQYVMIYYMYIRLFITSVTFLV